jgi:hypothetical protein
VKSVNEPTNSAGDPFPRNCELIEVHVAELKQLFNAIDPSPFRERDLDPNAEEFIDREFFSHRAQVSRQRLRQLFRRGRTSLVIGVTFLSVSLLLGDLIARLLGDHSLGDLPREGLLIRRMGRHVAPDGNLSLRLVADSRRVTTVRSSERDARSHRLQR